MNGEEEFFDAVTGFDSESSSGGFSEASQRVAAVMCVDSGRSNGVGKAGERPPRENGIQKHRTSLPAPMFTRSDFSVWSILKKCIGLVSSGGLISGPEAETFSIPGYLLHWLARDVLDAPGVTLPQASRQTELENPGVPSDPASAHTYLCREDLGFRFISEQVSHHPPISAFYSEGLHQDFLFHGSIYPKLKFWGKSVEAEPRGTITLELLKHNEAYTWTNPTCCVHNVIIGKLWIEQYGTVEILNHRTGDKCVLHFKPCGLFGKELHKVEGHIQDKNKKKLFMIYGKWTECLWGIDPAAYESFKKRERRGDHLSKPQPTDLCEHLPGSRTPWPFQETVQVIPGSKLLWRVNTRPPNSAQVRTPDPRPSPHPCPLARPDPSNGDMGALADLASQEKERLEEKQREARRERAKQEAEWQTRWFHQGSNPHTGAPDWLYAGGYFERNFSRCPDIY
uniref:Oxysterol-binding protein n=1 Tax=Panthera tigris altaica TaxID=74533 RepID=A0A8C9K6B2_PANTA